MTDEIQAKFSEINYYEIPLPLNHSIVEQNIYDYLLRNNIRVSHPEIKQKSVKKFFSSAPLEKAKPKFLQKRTRLYSVNF